MPNLSMQILYQVQCLSIWIKERVIPSSINSFTLVPKIHFGLSTVSRTCFIRYGIS